MSNMLDSLNFSTQFKHILGIWESGNIMNNSYNLVTHANATKSLMRKNMAKYLSLQLYVTKNLGK